MALQFFVSAADDTVGANGDFGLLLSSRMYIGPKVGGSWSGVAKYSSIGPSGPSFIYGSGAPSSSVGSDGQVYIDQVTFNAYGPKASGAWGGVTKALVGPQGIQGLKGDVGAASTVPGPKGDTGAASTVPGPKGDTGAASTVAGPKGDTGAASTVPGPQGTAGLGVLSGSGAPASSLGSVGQPAYIDTTAWAGYAAKTSAGWPTTFQTLIGPKGDQGIQGIQGVAGPNGAVIYSGSGAPTTANTATTVTAGSFYIQTDVTPNRLYGAYSTANGWPTTYVAMGGGSFIPVAGPPASTVGSVGDCAIDYVNGFFYPPKVAGGWTVAPINMNGLTGPAGFTTLPAAAIVPGQVMSVTSLALSTTPYVVPIASTTMPGNFKSPTVSALMGLGVTCNTAAVTMELYDQTAGVSVYTKTIAVNTDNTFGPFASNAYPMTAGNTHVWRLTGSGTTTISATPFYLQPSSQNVAAVCPVTNFVTPANTTFSTTSTKSYPGGASTLNERRHYFFRAGSIVNLVATYVPSAAGAAAASVQIVVGQYVINGSSSTVLTTTAVPNTGVPTVLGPYAAGTYTIPANSLVYLGVIGSGTGQVSIDLNVIV